MNSKTSKFLGFTMPSILAVMLVLIFSLSFGAFAQKEADSINTCQSLSDLKWILGNWTTTESSKNKFIILETWQQVSPNTYEGQGQTFDFNNTLLQSETLRLVSMFDEVFYFAKVNENPMPVPFKATKCNASTVTFENRQHDFPQQIIYQNVENGLNVRVQTIEGKGFGLELTRQ